MTDQQISFFNAKENQRHNLAMEQETNRANRANEQNARSSIYENVRHNKANESTDWYYKSNQVAIGFGELQNKVKTNLINQQHYERQDAINKQHFSAQDSIAYQEQAERVRHNYVTEQIAHDANAIGWEQAYTQWYNAETNRINAATNSRNASTREGELKLAQNKLKEEKVMNRFSSWATAQKLPSEIAKTNQEISNIASQQTERDARLPYTLQESQQNLENMIADKERIEAQTAWYRNQRDRGWFDSGTKAITSMFDSLFGN